MVAKQAVPTASLPLPQDVAPEELEDRALHYAAVALIEYLSAKANDTEDVAVQAVVFNLQNLMRLFDRRVFTLPIVDGAVEFRRSIARGGWETGDWELAWTVLDDAPE